MFWDDSIDTFGKVPFRDAHRGKVFLFWNLARVTGGKPVLVSLLAGQSSFDSEEIPKETLVTEVGCILLVLKTLALKIDVCSRMHNISVSAQN